MNLQQVHHHVKTTLLTIGLGLTSAMMPILATAAAQDSAKVDYRSEVRPILSDRCYHCHGPDAKNQESEYRMDSEDALMEAIEAGDLENSELYLRITSDDESTLMPPPDSNRILTDEEKQILKRWIEQGAQYEEGHWAFDLPVRPEVPVLEHARDAGWDKQTTAAWSRNPIDAFIAEKLIASDLKPSPLADWQTRIRRATLTLTGLLPSPEKVNQSTGQTEADYRISIDEILESMDYAERQTLRWLDASRYADTDGYQVDYHRENWPWRDWVTKAYHDNLPFDQFVIEQIAGDMIPNATYSQRLASAFNRNHRQNGEGGALADEFLTENVIDRVETTSTVFLGLTFGCSRCHDHKYDPLSQEEFFQLYGYFNNIGERSIGKGVDANPIMVVGSPLREIDPKWLDRVVEAESQLKQATPAFNKRLNKWTAELAGIASRIVAEEKAAAERKEADKQAADQPQQAAATKDSAGTEKQANQTKDAQSDKSSAPKKDAASDKNAAAQKVANAKKDDQPQPLTAAERERFASLKKDIQKILRKKSRHNGDRNKLRRYFTSLDPQQSRLDRAVKKARADFEKRGGKLAKVMVMREREGKPVPSYLLDRGQYNAPIKDKPLTRGVPKVLLPAGVDQPKDRYELGMWLVSKNNPLTARVIVNRMWRDHFGVGLVKTVDDFGVQGEFPSHPELLDWLAVEFIESGWNVKAMHRLMVTSMAYQQSSRVTEELRSMDPENRLLARGPRYRADGFTIRDIALQAAGLLNKQAGGPPVKPYQPPGLWEVVAANKGTRYTPDKGNRLYRKSMYSYWKRAVNPPRQAIFDAGGREVCSVQVRRTNTPLQALVLMNDQTFVEAARVLAEEVLNQDAKTEDQRLSNLYTRVIGRSVDDSSLKIMTECLDFYRDHYRDQPDEAKALLEVGAYQRDKQLSINEHAAMTMVAHVLMNVDEFLTIE